MSITKRAIGWYDHYDEDLATEATEADQLAEADWVADHSPDWRTQWAKDLRDAEWADKYHAAVAAGIMEP